MLALLTVLIQAAAPAPGPTVTVEGAKPERMICKARSTTGSRMGASRDCRTASEWARLQGVGADNRTVNDSMNTSGYNAGPDGSAAPVMKGPGR
jgi:hypothetical protein